jgi:protease-4
MDNMNEPIPKKIDRRVEANALNVLLIEHLERLNKLQESGFSVQKSELRWRNIRFALWFLLGAVSIVMYALFMSMFYSAGPDASPNDDYVSLVRMDGTISSDQKISAQRMVPALTRAFKDKKSKGVVLLINSPGGSPVQAGLIRESLLELRRDYPDKKVVTVAEDMLTSGAYMIALGTQEIYIARDTIAGSIGVIMSGFGFDGIMHKHGIERRLFTAGANKSFLDPYAPIQKNDLARARVVLDDTHRHFIEAVKESRGARLKGDDKTLFSGDFWVGDKAVSLGLVDGISNLKTVLKNVMHVEFARDYTPVQNFFDRMQDRLPGITQKALGLTDTPQITMY